MNTWQARHRNPEKQSQANLKNNVIKEQAND